MPWALSRKNDYFVFSAFHITFRVSMHREIFPIRILFFLFSFFSHLPFVTSPMLCVIATPVGSLMRDSRIGSNNKQVVNFSLPENADFTREVGNNLVCNRAVCNRIYAVARKIHLQLASLVFLKG